MLGCQNGWDSSDFGIFPAQFLQCELNLQRALLILMNLKSNCNCPSKTLFQLFVIIGRKSEALIIIEFMLRRSFSTTKVKSSMHIVLVYCMHNACSIWQLYRLVMLVV